MSPVNVNFIFGIPGPDPVIGSGPQVPLSTWQQNAIKSDLQILHDAFNINFTETAPATADLAFGAALFDFNAQPSSAFALADRAGSQAHVWFGFDRSDFGNPEVFQHAAAKAIAQALTLSAGDNGPSYATADNLSPYPYPGKGPFTVEELVSVGSKFGTTFHLSAADQQVARLYLGEFGRMPDHAGLDVQLNAFHSGTSLVALANAFLNTAEGLATFGTDRGATFVEHAYQAILGRQADQGGERVQVEALAHGLNPGQFIVNLVNSAEFLGRIHDGLLFT